VHDRGLISALTNGGDYFDLVELPDIDGVAASPAYRKQSIEGGMLRDEWGAVRVIGVAQQQMIAVARALAHHTKILILDEPTSGIDVGAKAEVHNIIADLANKGRLEFGFPPAAAAWNPPESPRNRIPPTHRGQQESAWRHHDPFRAEARPASLQRPPPFSGSRQIPLAKHGMSV
jgi:hypothetical protein